ncbi:MAG: acyl-phosphate glycerol 3-phosphate acyltransferase [Gammaproteobacteria bacterium]|nr:acyl-phosphate glycerol 3-phosphate acyltransferase [Gammaproteobacteria bacterium]
MYNINEVILDEPLIIYTILLTVSYLLGAINSSILLSRLKNLPDPREYGSKNPGATNILRSGEKLLAAQTLFIDILKGLIPTLFARFLGFDDLLILIVGCMSILGHVFPIYFRFAGGKGVATSFGVILGFDILLSIICLITWLSIAFLFRYSALSAIVTFVFLPLYIWLSYGSSYITIVTVLITCIVLWRHKENIHNLINQKEIKIGERES